VTEVAVARGAPNLGSRLSQRVVLDQRHGLGIDGLVKGRPATVAVELGAREEKLGVAAAAGVEPGAVFVQQLAGERSLGSCLAQNVELLGREGLTPLVFRALHRVICHAPIKLGNMADSEREETADWFRRFANAEGAESPRYRDWAEGIARDEQLLDLIGELPIAKRQPVLVLTCARVAGVPLEPFTAVRGEWVERWPDIAELARTRATQTNDPRRCTPLLVALNRIRGPIALIEVGASAGLTLIPDRYSYRWTAPGRTIESHPSDGESSVVLTADIAGWGANPPRRPNVVYREGIDLSPLDVRDADDRAWLEALVWPEQSERLELVHAAADAVAENPPLMTVGDALAQIRGAVARARAANRSATVLIWSPAVLVYLDPAAREKFASYCIRAKVRWVSLDGRRVIPRIGDAADAAGISGDFVLSVDGAPIASVDPLGRRVTLFNSSGLTPEEIDLIEFERENWGATRSKESLVRKAWSLPLVRYYQRLYAIMESPAARRYDSVVVRSFSDANAPSTR
jgi:hypothetical protein